MDISVVVPPYNEADNVRTLCDALTAVLEPLGRSDELILVDDGSRDATPRTLREIAAADPRVKVVRLRSNFGQTAALSAGLKRAAGDAVVTLDGDRQNDPADIPAMLAKLDEGYNFVHGWRKDRQDALLHRKIPGSGSV